MNLFESAAPKPLADRMRPKTLDEVVGQQHLLGTDQFLRKVIENGQPVSMILWGPPGSGKTTLARILARATNAAFVELSAVSAGKADIVRVVKEAKARIGQATILFVDEIHRFNKTQQDGLLPHVEDGTLTLIGATTENPSFEVITPLISRSRVVVLEQLDEAHLQLLLERAMAHFPGKCLSDDAKTLIAHQAAGDARVALNALETAAGLAKDTIDEQTAAQALQTLALGYDKKGEAHYNTISAFIKSLRGSEADAAMFYLQRMLAGGEDPKFIARRLVVFASEDVGLADPSALPLAVAAFQAVERVGLPEGNYALSHATLALAQAPKSRLVADKMGEAKSQVSNNPNAEVPKHLRNAPTKLMKELDYGKGYKWEADFKHPKGFKPKLKK